MKNTPEALLLALADRQTRRRRGHAQLQPARRRARAQPVAARRAASWWSTRSAQRPSSRSTASRRPDAVLRLAANSTRLAADADSANPAVTARRSGDGEGVLHLHLGHHRNAQGQPDDPLPVAQVHVGTGQHGCAVAPQRHSVLLPAALPQQRADGRRCRRCSRAGATLAHRQAVLGVEVLGRRRSATRRPRSSTSVSCAATCSTSPSRPTDRDNGIRLMVGNGLRAGDLGRIHRALRHRPRRRVLRRERMQHRLHQRAQRRRAPPGVCPLPYAVVEYDEETGKARRDANGRLSRGRHGRGRAAARRRSPTARRSTGTPTPTPPRSASSSATDSRTATCWFDTGDLVRKPGLHARRVRRPAR